MPKNVAHTLCETLATTTPLGWLAETPLKNLTYTLLSNRDSNCLSNFILPH